MNARYLSGRRSEYRTQRVLEAAGYETIRAASSKGVADVVAVRRGDVRLISVKSGAARLTAVERETLERLAKDALGCYTVECWRWPKGAKEPILETF